MKIFSFVSMINNFVLANGPGAAKGTTDTNSASLLSELFAGLLRLLSGVFTGIWGIIVNLLYVLAKLCLNIVDLLQYFVQKLVGIDVWQGGLSALSKIKDLGEMDVILKFITQPDVRNVFITITALSLILVAVFTIFGIIKSNYAAVADDGDKVENKPMAVIKRALKSMFLILIVPVIIIFGILGSNAILASVCNAISSNSQSSTMGGTIFVASAYDANKYRQYAKAQVRIPITVNDYTEVVNPSYYLTTNSMMQLMYKSVHGIVKIDAITNSNFFKQKNNGTYNGTEGWGSWISNLSHEEVLLMGETPSSEYEFSRDFNEFMSELFEGKLLSALGSKHEIIKSIYNQNITHNKRYQDNRFVFSDTVVVDNSFVFPQSSSSETIRIYKNSSLYQNYEPFATLPYEYYVMADLMDFAVESGSQFFIVNANSDAIVWDGIVSYNSSYTVHYKQNAEEGTESSYYVGTTEAARSIYNNAGYNKIATGAFYVSYYDGTNRLYWSNTNSLSEEQGSTYIICKKTDAGYIPFTHGSDGFKSSFLASGYAGAIVARGIFKPESVMALDYNLPTYISEQYVDNRGYEVSTSYLGQTSLYNLLDTDFVEYDLGIGAGGAIEKGKVLSSSKFTSYSISGTELTLRDKFDSVYKDKFDVEYAETFYAMVQIQKIDSDSDIINKLKLQYSNGTLSDVYSGFRDQLYAKVVYKVIKFKYSEVEGVPQYAYIISDYQIDGIGSHDGIVVTGTTITDFGVFDTYEYVAPQLDLLYGMVNVYRYSSKALETRDGKVYEAGTNKVFFSTSQVNKGNIITDNGASVYTRGTVTSNLYNYNLLAFSLNPMKEFTTSSMPFYKSVKNSSGGAVVTSYNKYKGETATSSYANVYESLSLTAKDFVYLALVFDAQKKLIDVIPHKISVDENGSGGIGSDVSNDANFRFRNIFINDNLVSVVNIPVSAIFSFDYYKHATDSALDRVYGAQITSVSVGTSYDSAKVDGNNYFSVFNNGIFCDALGKTVLSSADVKTLVNRDLIYSSSSTLTYEIYDDEGVVVDKYTLNLRAFSEESWNSATLANFENFYIYFTRGDVSMGGFIDINIFFNVISFMKLDFDFVFRFKIAAAYNYAEEVLYRLSAGSFVLDYNFNAASGIGIKYLYTLVNLDPLILVFATLILIATFLKIVWGLIARIYEIIILYILMPAYTSTMPLDDGERFKRWKDAIVEKVLMAYGTLITINIFLLLLDLVKDVTDGLINFNDLPKTVTNGLSAIFTGGGGSMIGSIGTNLMGFASSVGNFVADFFVKISSLVAQLTESQMVYSNFINKIVYLLFFLVLTTTLSSAPIFINKILGGEDLLQKSKETQAAAKENVEKVSSYTSGKGIKDSFGFAKKNTIGALPGGERLLKNLETAKGEREKKRTDRFKQRWHIGEYDPDYQPGGRLWTTNDANQAINAENLRRARAGLDPIPVAGTGAAASENEAEATGGDRNEVVAEDANIVEGENNVAPANEGEESTGGSGAARPQGRTFTRSADQISSMLDDHSRSYDQFSNKIDAYLADLITQHGEVEANISEKQSQLEGASTEDEKNKIRAEIEALTSSKGDIKNRIDKFGELLSQSISMKKASDDYKEELEEAKNSDDFEAIAAQLAMNFTSQTAPIVEKIKNFDYGVDRDAFESDVRGQRAGSGAKTDKPIGASVENSSAAVDDSTRPSSSEDAVIANLTGSVGELQSKNSKLGNQIRIGKFESPEEEKKIKAEYAKNNKLISENLEHIGNLQMMKSKKAEEFATNEARIAEFESKIAQNNDKIRANKRRISDSADMDATQISKQEVNKMIADNKLYESEIAKYQKQKQKVENVRTDAAEKAASAKVAEIAGSIASGKLGLDAVTSEQLISSLDKRMSVGKEIDSEIASHNAKLKTLKNDKKGKQEKLEINGKISALKQVKSYNAAGISNIQKVIDKKIEKNSTKTVQNRKGSLEKMDGDIEKLSSKIESMTEKKRMNSRNISDASDMDETIVSRASVKKMINENVQLEKNISKQNKEKLSIEKARSGFESKQIASDVVKNAKGIVGKKADLASIGTEDLYKVLGSRKLDASKIDKNLASDKKKLASAKLTDTEKKALEDKIKNSEKIKRSTKTDISALEKVLAMKLSKTSIKTTPASERKTSGAATVQPQQKPASHQKPGPKLKPGAEAKPGPTSEKKPSAPKAPTSEKKTEAEKKQTTQQKPVTISQDKIKKLSDSELNKKLDASRNNEDKYKKAIEKIEQKLKKDINDKASTIILQRLRTFQVSNERILNQIRKEIERRNAAEAKKKKTPIQAKKVERVKPTKAKK